MLLTIIVKHEGKEYALAKATTVGRIQGTAQLVQEFMPKLWPDAVCWVSTDTVLNGEVEMHPDRDWIINKLREIALPHPRSIIEIETEYERL